MVEGPGSFNEFRSGLEPGLSDNEALHFYSTALARYREQLLNPEKPILAVVGAEELDG